LRYDRISHSELIKNAGAQATLHFTIPLGLVEAITAVNLLVAPDE
jgi:hypothetical protein